VTPPEGQKGRDADKTAVITKPKQQPADKPAAAASGGDAEQVTKPVTPPAEAEKKTEPEAEKPAAEAKPEPDKTQEVKAPEVAKTQPAPAPVPETKPAPVPVAETKPDEKTVKVEKPVTVEDQAKAAAVATPAVATPAAEEQDAVVAAPPPWQRVQADAQYEAPVASIPPISGIRSEPAESPAYPSMDPDNRGYPATEPDTVSVARPVLSGTAASALGLGNRTSVNLGTNGRPAAAAPSARRPGRGPRRASLQIKRVDPWSVLKLALVLGVALFFVWLVAVGVLYGVLHGMGVWDKINSTANDLLQSSEPTGEPLISAGRVFGVSAIIGAVNIVLFTALATVGAFVYNVSADLAGGLELTLSERE
jgi:hypothetical protein